MKFNPTHVQVLGDHDACGIGFVADRWGRASHALLGRGLEALMRLTHRGGGGDALGAADGCGVLTAIPWTLLDGDCGTAPGARPRAAGLCFVPHGTARDVQRIVERALAAEGWTFCRWRTTPADAGALGAIERADRPDVVQVVTSYARDGAPDASLYRARCRAEHRLAEAGVRATIVSLSTRTMVYKALVAPVDLPRVYPDLADARYTTPFVVFHQRFSTNTFPDWAMAQPFRTLAHNGEINTIVGNRLKAARRQHDRAALPEAADVDLPIVSQDGSDSRSLDDQITLLLHGGLSLPHAVARTVRRAWEHDRSLSAEERAFEQFQSCVSDSWEGPAALALADGRYVGLVVDRSGFRPARVVECRSGLVVGGSETGIVDVPDDDIVSQRRVGPGEMLFVDLERHCTLDDGTLRRLLAERRPYRSYVQRMVTTLPGGRSRRGRLDGSEAQEVSHLSDTALRRCQRQFAYTSEELELILRPMLQHGHEAVGSMGDDTPLAAFSARSRVLPDFFRQRFAQVTNPPLDPLRERAVMSLRTVFGRQGRLLGDEVGDARMVAVESPVLTLRQLAALTTLQPLGVTTLASVFDPHGGATALEAAVAQVVAQTCAAVRGGACVVVLSDRSVGETCAPLPPLLVTSAVWHALARAGLGTRAALVVDTGEARDAHQVATLLGFGAAAVCPWLGYATVQALAARTETPVPQALTNYRGALEEGLLKILSKMGVCTSDAYRGSQLFEIVGLDRTLSQDYFPSTAVIAGRIGVAQLAADACARHDEATRRTIDALPHPGFHGFRRDGDHHLFNPAVVKAFHRASGSGSPEAYTHFTTLLQSRPVTAVRDLLTFVPRPPVPLEQVEPVESICQRFFASAMSIGALGPEAHRTLAIALNRLGARSNSGEGGEEPERCVRAADGTWANSATKQIASARFGVTPAYLASARELQIKMAQGSKPGEGGQLPADKVVGHIARLRHAPAGTPLISPPPHHDIYSIEDLAQLIDDLRAFQPGARINVKLVSTTGVGVIAAGVVKAGATAIQISGHAGGTGASPRGSIKHAGLPWEIGLLEAHRVLTARGMRARVVLQTDGGLVTGRDIALAAALGADEYGFGTAALVALGCVMARQCHLNTCPVGIATQRPDLRAKFAGSVGQVIAYLRMVAAETREILASLGLRSVSELIGRVDLLAPRTDVERPGIDVGALLDAGSIGRARAADARRPTAPDDTFAARLRQVQWHLGRVPVHIESRVANTDRSVGTAIMGALARRHGNRGVPHAPVRITLTGHAGQSLGAFALPGTAIDVCGTANDGVGKGMHGGVITVRGSRPGDVIIGNAALYGATGGRLFVSGRTGERFAVRNSGAVGVVEGVGHHGCEYMTGGTVIVLGDVGRNFAAGMTGGVAFVHDTQRSLASRINREYVLLSRVTADQMSELLNLVQEHHARTRSAVASALLSDWPRARRAFRAVVPRVFARDASAVVDTGRSRRVLVASGLLALRREDHSHVASRQIQSRDSNR